MAKNMIMEEAVGCMFDQLKAALLGACYLGKDQAGLPILAGIFRGLADDIENKTLSGESMLRIQREIHAYALASLLECRQ